MEPITKNEIPINYSSTHTHTHTHDRNSTPNSTPASASTSTPGFGDLLQQLRNNVHVHFHEYDDCDDGEIETPDPKEEFTRLLLDLFKKTLIPVTGANNTTATTHAPTTTHVPTATTHVPTATATATTHAPTITRQQKETHRVSKTTLEDVVRRLDEQQEKLEEILIEIQLLRRTITKVTLV